MIDYSKGKIYKIISEKGQKIYIGSTIRSLNQRLTDHKCKYNIYILGTPKARNISSFRVIEFGDAIIELIENYPCENKKELLIRERYWIEYYRENVDGLVNKHIPIRGYEEKLEISRQYKKDNRESVYRAKKIYVKKNAEKYRLSCKKSWDKNRDKYNKQQREKYAKNKEYLTEKIECECGMIVSRDCKRTHILKKNHYDNLKKKGHIFTEEENKKMDELLEKGLKVRHKQKMVCECGVNINIGSKARHLRTERHIKKLQNKISE